MNIEKNFNLKNINTFKIDVNAKFYVKCFNDRDVIKSINFAIHHGLDIFPLGKGSNVLFTQDFKGIVLHILTSGIKIIKETEDFVFIKVKSGEVWNNFVLFCLKHNYGGIENLSLIPGSVGGSVIQNIGAYGVEVQNVIVSISAIKIGKIDMISKIDYVRFTKDQCNFDYRYSYFQSGEEYQWIIMDATFKLTKKNHKISASYQIVKKKLKEENILYPTIHNISNIIINIRVNKFLNVKKFGNAGSFFKNPTIDVCQYNILKKKYYDLEGFKVYNGIRVSAGYFIRKIGMQGLRIGNYGIHPDQPLILVNYSNARGRDIVLLSEKIKTKVLEKFNINLLTEVILV